MTKYQVVYGYNCDIVEIDEPTTDYQYIVDTLVDRLEAAGNTGCFVDIDKCQGYSYDEFSFVYYEDEYVIAGNHCLALYHGGNFHIEEVA